MRRLLLNQWLQQKGAGRSEIAKADIREIRPLRQFHLQQHMNSGARGVDRQSSDYAALQTGDAITERAKRRSEQHVLLETIPATLAGDHLGLKRRHVEFGRTPKHDVQRLVTDRVRVRENQAVQGFKCWRQWPGIADPFKPRGLVELGL